MLTAVGKHKINHVFFVAEGRRSQIAKHQDPTYKGNRKPLVLPSEIVQELRLLPEVCSLFGMNFMRIESYEADDVIASLALFHRRLGYNTYIMTLDKDMFFLLNEGVKIMDLKDGLITHHDIRRKFHVEPRQLPDLLSLAGDSSDNIKGVRGIGVLKAARLLSQYGTLMGILKRGDRQNREVIKVIKDLRNLMYSRRQVMLDTSLLLTPDNWPVLIESLRRSRLRPFLNDREGIRCFLEKRGLYAMKDRIMRLLDSRDD